MNFTQNIENLNSWLQDFKGQKVFFLVDENTHEHCLPPLLGSLPNLLEYEILEVEPGEETKSLEIAANLWLSLAELGAERSDVIINVGGGVVTDLGGFIASTYKRGIPFINVPTSLLAMVDAAHGGKTGIDLAGAKNLVGTFVNSELCYLEGAFLETLPKAHLKSGFAELLKHGLIADRLHWEEACRSYPEISGEMIERSASIKMKIVESDPFEKGARKLLNFGHTVGHAIESFLLDKGLPILHGEAVAVGMLIEANLSVRFTQLGQEDFEEISQRLDAIYPRLPLLKQNVDGILKWLKFDKKNTNGELQLSLLRNIGEGVYNISLSEKEVKSAILNYIKQS